VPKFRRQFAVHYSSGEINHEPSRTVPDQHLSIAQLLINHSRGLGSDVKNYQGEFFEDEIISPINDLTDLAERREQLKSRQRDLEQQIAEMQKSGEIQETQEVASTAPLDPSPTLTTKHEPNGS